MEDSLNLGVNVHWRCETRFEGMRTGVNRFLWIPFRTLSFCTAVAPSQSPPIWEVSTAGCDDLGRSGLPALMSCWTGVEVDGPDVASRGANY